MKGQAKTHFKEWYESNPRHTPISTPYSIFMGKHPSMQYGVIVDFFDSVGLEINIDRDFDFVTEQNLNWQFSIADYVYKTWCVTRPEARQAAIDKACEILNERLKG